MVEEADDGTQYYRNRQAGSLEYSIQQAELPAGLSYSEIGG
jgi:hypothetical protein